MTANLWVVIFPVELGKKWSSSLATRKKSIKQTLSSLKLLVTLWIERVSGILGAFSILSGSVSNSYMGNGHVSWCYTADGFVCILRKIFCILYQAFVRHNIPIHFIFNRFTCAVHWSLPVMSFIVVPIYFHFAIYLRNQSKNISWSELACTLVTPNM